MPSELDTSFDLLEVGVEGRLTDVPPLDGELGAVRLPRKTLPVGLPPVLPEICDDVERYLTCLDSLPIHDFQKAQHVLPRTARPDRLLACHLSPLTTTIQVERNLTTGELLGYKEEYLEEIGKTSRNSLSLRRQPDPSSNEVRGSTANFPFWPGGLDEPELDDLTVPTDSSSSLASFEELLTVPPDLESGMTFSSQSAENLSPSKLPQGAEEAAEPAVLTLADILAVDGDDDLTLQDSGQEEEEKEVEMEKTDLVRSDSLEKLVPEVEKKESSREAPEPLPERWAVLVDINSPVSDFHKRVPRMAYEYPFELDVFQKQAVLHLESCDCVFVAAHTSAGKTVVAEYAIALSLLHKTRSIYTSPIKALSNQKYRDFKQTFKDVGLVTGDVQINQTGACLIMTTEILRSMLYNGSDVIRDLEWVIFDEVHYINDSERGVVWEEVLIMLPDHVRIILLSATVPNTEEFANWVGRTKRKKMYVISTQKRPVPLEHYLYTGNSNKTNNQLFLLLDAQGNFLTTGYSKAMEAKKERASKSSQSFGPKGPRGGNPAQDKNVWLSLIDMLKKKDKLPMVAFIFSKRRIEDTAQNLRSIDLTTAEEKSAIHVFFQSCVTRLKGSDRKLPQVLQMADLLKRGVGIHHSGVLPILKEVVEMLFQRGLVKILFATETFAMGVNMPARTVVFDNIRKNDGTCFRNLLPGEYIQMAGRAGRRGLDSTGTVILLCKGDVPEMADLHRMMLGKPTKLESQFRLTYSMILNLLRVEQLRVEDMMKRSYSEFHSQKELVRHRQALVGVVGQLGQQQELQCYLCHTDLEAYHAACLEYHRLQAHLQSVFLTHPAALKALSPGRVVTVTQGAQKRVLGLVLNSSLSAKGERTFCVLVLAERGQAERDGEAEGDQGTGMSPVMEMELWQPEGPCWHALLQVKGENIAVITQKTIKVEADKIINDVRKRQQARFRDDPPSQSVSVATQELLRLTESSPQGLAGLDPVKDFGLRDIALVEQCRALQLLLQSFQKFQCTHCPKFPEHFAHMCSVMELREEYKRLKFLLSDESLLLLPEYQQRMQVLERLNYIDSQRAVQLKGRVACEISTHELMITELVFDNVLTELQPADIAALLSCMVFEQKHTSDPNLTDSLKAGKEKILAVAQNIGRLQKECGMQVPVEDYCSTFKFGLMEVVLEWARGMEFAEIMCLTDVQEGIVVRCIQRLHEMLRDVRNAARIIGDPVLHQKMEESMNMIKRDIVFAASLYTQ